VLTELLLIVMVLVEPGEGGGGCQGCASGAAAAAHAVQRGLQPCALHRCARVKADTCKVMGRHI